MQIQRGQKTKLATITTSQQLSIGIGTRFASSNSAKVTVDIACFGLDAAGKLSDERYFVFFNQKHSPEGAIEMLAGQGEDDQRFGINLATLPPHIRRLVFTATIDGQAIMGGLHGGHWRLLAAGQELARFALHGTDYGQEKALIVAEIYFKDEWRMTAVGQGFAGGLGALLRHFGGEELIQSIQATPTQATPTQATPTQAAPTQATPTQAMPTSPTTPSSIVLQKRLQLDKKLEQQAPKLLSLAKKAELSLKKVGLETHQARVALCLDISASMSGLYSAGKVQRLAEKALALGTRFDDNGAIDIFLFGERAHSAGEMTTENFANFIGQMQRRFPLEGGTNYAKAMQLIRQHYFGAAPTRKAAFAQAMPVYVMFVTDGQPFDPDQSRQQVRDSAFEPLFWQFIGLGQSRKDVSQGKGFTGLLGRMFASDFSFLESLDEMSGRYIDNANFFSIADPEAIDDEKLYGLLTSEYPSWVAQLGAKKLFECVQDASLEAGEHQSGHTGIDDGFTRFY
jgi:stress response protein SCP2